MSMKHVTRVNIDTEIVDYLLLDIANSTVLYRPVYVIKLVTSTKTCEVCIVGLLISLQLCHRSEEKNIYITEFLHV